MSEFLPFSSTKNNVKATSLRITLDAVGQSISLTENEIRLYALAAWNDKIEAVKLFSAEYELPVRASAEVIAWCMSKHTDIIRPFASPASRAAWLQEFQKHDNG